MSEAADLVTPEAAAPAQAAGATEAPAAQTPAPAAEAAAAELVTPEPEAGEGEAAAAAGQGAGKGEAAKEGGASEGEGAAREGEGEAKGAPETYADFTLPEGIAMDPTLGSDVIALAKELNLPQDKAQKLVDIGVKQAQAFQTAMKSSVEAAKAAWIGEVRADPELGGVNLSTNMAVAKKAMVAFGSPKLVGLMNETGLGQHPEFLRLLFNVGSAIGEDTLVDGGSGAGGKPALRDHAKRMYPNMK